MDKQSSAGARPLIVTRDQDLLEQLLRLCAAAGVTADLVESPEAARQTWSRATAILVGDDLAAAASRLDLPRREHVLLVSTAREHAALWQLAVALRADDVVVLPTGQLHLAERLSDLADGPTRGRTVAVVAGSGGAGASTLASALALTAARARRVSQLIDADGLGGGIDLVVGCEDSPGLRWREVAATHGRVTAAAFRAALPTVGDLAVLSFDRAGDHVVDPVVMRSMLGAAQRGSEIVIVDLPRRLDDAATEAALCADVLLLLATTEVRGVAAAQVVLSTVRDLSDDIRLAVRRLPGGDLTAAAVAKTVGLPLVAAVDTRSSVGRSVNEGLGPLSRGHLQRVCTDVLDALVPPPGAVR